MKKLILLSAALLLFAAASMALAESITVTWTFQDDLTDGFKLYQNAVPICDSPGGDTRLVVCPNVLVPYGDNEYTMVSYIGGTVGPLSAPVIKTKVLGAPTILSINF